MPAILESVSVREKPQQGRLHFRRAPVFTCAAFYALVLFVTINLGLWFSVRADKALSRDLWSGTGSVDLVVDDFKRLPNRPSVVLLGSSLVMFPFWSMDHARDPSVNDIFHHHGSYALEEQLRDAGFLHPTVFNMAVFGQMASDAYLYVDEFLKGKKKPDYVVLGIAPRDFYDADLPSPMSTVTFRRLVDLSNFFRYAPLYLPSWQDKADLLAEHTCFFYGQRWHIQREFVKGVKKAYAFLPSNKDFLEPGARKPAGGFMMYGTAQERWRNSLDEYRRRYHDIDGRDLSVQFSFLSRVLEVCRKRDIRVIVVNMPLTDDNRALFPSGFYRRFSSEVGQICGRDGARYMNLGSASEFVHADFWDTTHLSYPGGYKLLNRLIPAIMDQHRPEARRNFPGARTSRPFKKRYHLLPPKNQVVQ